MNCEKPSILFVCTGNAGRSQMAQAMLRRLVGDEVEIESAGVEPWDHLHPMAVRLMAERGISLDGHYPKSAESVADRAFDVVVTIGDPARAKLPERLRSTGEWIHWDISDPADADDTPDSEAVFSRTAEAIEKKLPELTERLSRI